MPLSLLAPVPLRLMPNLEGGKSSAVEKWCAIYCACPPLLGADGSPFSRWLCYGGGSQSSQSYAAPLRENESWRGATFSIKSPRERVAQRFAALGLEGIDSALYWPPLRLNEYVKSETSLSALITRSISLSPVRPYVPHVPRTPET